MKSLTPFLLALSLLGTTTFTAACDHHEGGHHENGTFEATHPLRTDTSLTREYVAWIQAAQHIEVRAMEKGYLDSIFVDEGQHIHQGDHLFQIMPVLYRAEAAKAHAEVEFAQIEYENTHSLYDRNVVSDKELALARAELDQAKAQRDLAGAHLNLTRLDAPFDGIVGRLEVRRGSLVDEGELLTTLSDNSQMWVYFNLTEPEYLQWARQPADERPDHVTLVLADGAPHNHEGIITAVESDFDNETGNIAFRATVPNPDGILRHGETGKLQLVTPLKDALIIPQKATFEVLDKSFVFAVDPDGIVHQREVHIAHQLPHVYVVDKGIVDGDVILLEGLRKVREGDHVDIELQDSQEVVASLDEIHAE